MSGRFISFEGVEGGGKTTQVARLKAALEAEGYPVLSTREPGGTEIGERIRTILLDPDHNNMAPLSELLLYSAARAQHVHEVIAPALEAGYIVLCDRFADSTTAYQGAGRTVAPDVVATLHHIATHGIWPELTIVLDMPIEAGLARVGQVRKHDRIELEAVAFHERVRQAFLALADQESQRVKVVDASQSIGAVAANIQTYVRELLDRE